MIPSSRQSATTEVSRCAIAAWASRTWAFDSANVLSPWRPRGREPGPGTFADQLPLELGQRREDAEHEATGGGRGVDLCALPGEHPQAHAAGRQVLHGVDQVGKGAAEAVELPDDEHVARPERAHTAVEPGSVVAYAGPDCGGDQGPAPATQVYPPATRCPHPKNHGNRSHDGVQAHRNRNV